jgi:polyhydroxybutyrate depolymerase
VILLIIINVEPSLPAHQKRSVKAIISATAGRPPPSRRGTVTVTAAAQALIRQTTRTITIGGLRRIYLLLQPVGSTERLPLVILLHGRGLTPTAMVALSGLAPLVADSRMILAVPMGLDRSWNAGAGCCGPAGRSRPDDSTFVRMLVTTVLHEEYVDTRRVYLAGYSNGGKLALRMACEDPAAFAGVATYGAVPLVPCAHGHPVSVLLAAGTADQVLPYNGARLAQPPLMSMAAAVALWRDRDGCPARSTTLSHVGPAEIVTWHGCQNHTTVTAVIYHGLPHAWPAPPRVPAAAGAAIVIWNFFAGLPGAPAPSNPPAAVIARSAAGAGPG